MSDATDDLDLRTVRETSNLGVIAIAAGILEGADIAYLAKGEGSARRSRDGIGFFFQR